MNFNRTSIFSTAAAMVVLVLIPSAAFPLPKQSGAMARKFFLHIHTPGGSGVAQFVFSLSTKDYPDEGSGSANVFDGAGNEAFIVTGAREPATHEFPTVDGTPFRLDASSEITGVIALEAYRIIVSGQEIPVGMGASTVEVTLTGKLRSGKDVSLGEQRFEVVVTPAQETYLLEVNIPTPESLDRKQFASLTLAVRVRGPSVMAGALELDDPASFIEVPILG